MGVPYKHREDYADELDGIEVRYGPYLGYASVMNGIMCLEVHEGYTLINVPREKLHVCQSQ